MSKSYNIQHPMKVTILYGSATGNAEQIAKRLASSVNDGGGGPFRSADVMEMNRFKRDKLFEKWTLPPPTAGATARGGGRSTPSR